MPRFTALLAAAAFAATAALQLACSDSARISQPERQLTSTGSFSLASNDADGVHRIEILDACDPTSFDAVFGVGTCVRSGGRNLFDFLAEVTAKQEAGAWRFASANVEARVGQTLLAVNRGGEKHTFTEVRQFGGGLNPILNELSHNPNVAPECATSTLVDAGASTTDALDEEGTELYQCCIHPWMRTTVHVRS
jgi:plastocyanin